MTTINQQFRIASIHYDNTATKVLIKGETINNQLSYQSEMFVNFSHLNHILCELLRTNTEISLEDLTTVDVLGDYLATSIVVDHVQNRVIDLNNIQQDYRFMQIRA